MQSQPGVLHLLPALPPHWRDGRVTGMRARGGLTVDLNWSGGSLESASLEASRQLEIEVETAGRRARVRLGAGERCTLTGAHFV